MDEILGKEFETNSCGKCVVVGYKGSRNVIVKFHNPRCIVKCQMGRLNRGQVKNPLASTLYGKGFIGIGKYSSKDITVHKLWNGVLRRCYSESTKSRQPKYKDVTVCDEWLDFQNFAEWCYSQKGFTYKDERGKVYHLDKDILVKGNKVYSPETCCFVPRDINALLILSDKSRGEYPIGVSLNKRAGMFFAQISRGTDERKNLGYFKTPEEAFQAYKEAKESYIKEVAECWKDNIDEKVYKVLTKWEIRIDD